MGMPFKLTSTQISQMRELADAGTSYREIGRRLGISDSTVAYHLGHAKVQHPPKKVTDQMVEDMVTYRELGLSNSQIAIELGISPITVRRHLGKQKDANRACYGSIVAHTTGESFAPKEVDMEQRKEERNMEKNDQPAQERTLGLQVSSFQLVLNGRSCTYTIQDGKVTIAASTSSGGGEITIPIKSIAPLSKELAALSEVVKVSLFSVNPD